MSRWTRTHKVTIGAVGAVFAAVIGCAGLGAALSPSGPDQQARFVAAAPTTDIEGIGTAPTTAPTTPAAPTPSRSTVPSRKPSPRSADRHTSTASARPKPSPTRSTASPIQVVRAGTFCSPAGAVGITSRGTPMVCGPASDGRNRWHHI